MCHLGLPQLACRVPSSVCGEHGAQSHLRVCTDKCIRDDVELAKSWQTKVLHIVYDCSYCPPVSTTSHPLQPLCIASGVLSPSLCMYACGVCVHIYVQLASLCHSWEAFFGCSCNRQRQLVLAACIGEEGIDVRQWLAVTNGIRAGQWCLHFSKSIVFSYVKCKCSQNSMTQFSPCNPVSW